LRSVVWTAPAQRANRAIVRYLGQEADEQVARLVHGRILAAAERLGETPTGRPSRNVGTYEKSVARTGYIIVYAVREWAGREFIFILSVVHARRNGGKVSRHPPNSR